MFIIYVLTSFRLLPPGYRYGLRWRLMLPCSSISQIVDAFVLPLRFSPSAFILNFQILIQCFILYQIKLVLISSFIYFLIHNSFNLILEVFFMKNEIPKFIMIKYDE